MRRIRRQRHRCFEALEPRRVLSGLTSLTLTGTDGDDEFSAFPGLAILNGVEYRADLITFDGGSGNDDISLYDSPGDDVFTAGQKWAEMVGPEFSVKVTNAETIHGYAKAGGLDTGRLYDSSGDDRFTSRDKWGRLIGAGYLLRAKFFEALEVFASEGLDFAHLEDSPGDDVFRAWPEEVTLLGSSSLRGRGFDYVQSHARRGGHDVAYLNGSSGDDSLTAEGNWARLTSASFESRANEFEEVHVFGDAGQDSARLYASGYSGLAENAQPVSFDGGGGQDTVHVYDSRGSDVFIGRPLEAEMIGDGFSVKVTNVEEIHGYALNGGQDKAQLYDSAGDDFYVNKTGWAKLYGEGYHLRAKAFEQVEAYASGGTDEASLNDSPSDDVFYARPGTATLFNGAESYQVEGFDYVHGYARYGGYDIANLHGSADDDWLVGKPNWVRLRGDGFSSRAKFFEEVSVYGEGGRDAAHLYGSDQDKFVQKPEFRRLEGDDFSIRAGKFSEGLTHGIKELSAPIVEDSTVVLAGIQTLRRSITMESGMTLTGDAVLTRPDRVQAELTSNAEHGDTLFHVTSTAGFQTGDELGLFAYGTQPTWIMVAEVGPDWIRTEEPISGPYDTVDSASLVNYFPLIRATDVVNVTIDGLTLDGNFDLSNGQWRIVGGGLIQWDGVEASTIRNTTIQNAPASGVRLAGGNDNLIENITVMRSRGHGIFLDEEIDTTIRSSVSSWNGYKNSKRSGDGILVNGSSNVVVENSVTEHNRGYGLHPAGDLTRGGRWTQNEARYNGAYGFFFCWNNFDIRVEDSIFVENRKGGIGGLGLGGLYGDRFNTVIDNIATGNTKYGIVINGGSDNTIAGNDFRDNGRDGMLVNGDHVIYGNLVD